MLVKSRTFFMDMRRWINLKMDGFIMIREYSNNVVRIFDFTEIAKSVLSENVICLGKKVVVFCCGFL